MTCGMERHECAGGRVEGNQQRNSQLHAHSVKFCRVCSGRNGHRERSESRRILNVAENWGLIVINFSDPARVACVAGLGVQVLFVVSIVTAIRIELRKRREIE